MVYVKNSTQKGFTLFEIMVVLGILGALIAIFYPRIQQMREDGKIRSAKLELRFLQERIDAFEEDTKVYPASLMDLIKPPANPAIAQKWISGPYLPKKYKSIPKDPWKQPYVYSQAKDGSNPYTLYSRGGANKRKISVWILD